MNSPEIEDLQEKLRQFFAKRRDLGYTGARRGLAPAVLKEKITKTTAQLRALKLAHDR